MAKPTPTSITKPPARYRWLSALAWPLWLAHAVWLALRDKDILYLPQRLALRPPSSSATIWVHASSVGEINALAPLLKRWQQKDPAAKLFFSTHTVTGKRALARNFPDAEHAYLPIDNAFLVRSWLRQQPFRQLILMETELWPWLLHQSRQQGMAISVLNARLSPKSYRPQHFLFPVIRYAVQQLNNIYCRSEADAERFQSLSDGTQEIEALGNIKLIQSLPEKATAHPLNAQRFLLCASTHDDEEAQILQAWKNRLPQTCLVLAPRHPQRADALMRDIEQRGFTCQRHSQQQEYAQAGVYLVDTLGDLAPFYAHAEAVFMGGSLVAIGGHNLYEAAAYSAALLCGPSVFNISEDFERFQQAHAVLPVTHAEGLVEAFATLLKNPEQRHALQKQAFMLAQQGAAIADNYLPKLEAIRTAARPASTPANKK